jgi:hypothetical protein
MTLKRQNGGPNIAPDTINNSLTVKRRNVFLGTPVLGLGSEAPRVD